MLFATLDLSTFIGAQFRQLGCAPSFPNKIKLILSQAVGVIHHDRPIRVVCSDELVAIGQV